MTERTERGVYGPRIKHFDSMGGKAFEANLKTYNRKCINLNKNNIGILTEILLGHPGNAFHIYFKSYFNG